MEGTHPRLAMALGAVRVCLREATTGPVLVACSGGPDSIALLGLLHALREHGPGLRVAHVDHGLRPDSVRDAQHVRALARDLGWPVDVVRLDLAAGADVAARARIARRRALVELAVAAGSSSIALGHTRTDQAETFLLQAVRGAGVRGLASMRAVEPWEPAAVGDRSGTPGRWLRPLLDVARSETAELAAALGLSWVHDPTNERVDHPRVRVRTQVLPQLAAINPQVERALARAAERCAEADAALTAWAETAWHACSGDGSLDARAIADLPRALRTRLLRRLCIEGGVTAATLSAAVLADIDAGVQRGRSGRAWDLHPRRRLVLADGRAWIEVRTT